MTKISVKYQYNWHKTEGGVTHKRHLVSIHFGRKNDYAHCMEKVTINNLRIISNQYAYFQTITETHVKFRNVWHKTVGEVAHTKYLDKYIFTSVAKMTTFSL